MKKIILTVDYELFLGQDTGTIKNCMIDPTNKLLSVLMKYGSKMTVFWDILHFHRLQTLENQFAELKEDRIRIENQILDLYTKGHDIQLHLHPHWLDAKYINNKWIFNYKRFKLHNFEDYIEDNDIKSIYECIHFAKTLMERIIRKKDSKYSVTTFRAGGYLIEPFNKIKEAFLLNGISIDSSVCPKLYNKNLYNSYDFRGYPDKIKYKFSISPQKIDSEGYFTEIPITTIHFSFIKNIYFKILKGIKYPTLEDNRSGKSISSSNKKNKKIKKILTILLYNHRYQFTTDSNFFEKFNYMFKQVPPVSTIIIHPKLLNQHVLDMLNYYLNNNQIQFISIRDFLE